mmetsp:Transcript_9300/g.17808  ORF Transcript_9300/g.17808 Transcript_9300/m.17808 type:complete len:194 (+) Transcript_9300:2795-3376(+)
MVERARVFFREPMLSAVGVAAPARELHWANATVAGEASALISLDRLRCLLSLFNKSDQRSHCRAGSLSRLDLSETLRTKAFRTTKEQVTLGTQLIKSIIPLMYLVLYKPFKDTQVQLLTLFIETNVFATFAVYPLFLVEISSQADYCLSILVKIFVCSIITVSFSFQVMMTVQTVRRMCSKFRSIMKSKKISL